MGIWLRLLDETTLESHMKSKSPDPESPCVRVRAYRLALLAFVRSAKYSNKEKDLWEAAELSAVGRALLVINRLVPMNEEIK